MALPRSSSPATAPLPSRVAFQLATSSREPPVGDGWLYEVKHDGHRLAVVADGSGGVRLLSRNGYERSRLFGPVFADLARIGRRVVLDGEIAAPDARGVTHEAITVAEIIDDKLTVVGEVKFGVGRRLRAVLEAIRLDPRPGRRRVPVRPGLVVEIKYFGRHRSGVIRDGVVRAVTPLA
jgi:ATP-dependent DNA ligase